MFEKQAVSVPVPDEIANAYPMHLIGDESSTLIKHGRVQKALEFGITTFYARIGCVDQASNEATSSSAKRLGGWKQAQQAHPSDLNRSRTISIAFRGTLTKQYPRVQRDV